MQRRRAALPASYRNGRKHTLQPWEDTSTVDAAFQSFRRAGDAKTSKSGDLSDDPASYRGRQRAGGQFFERQPAPVPEPKPEPVVVESAPPPAPASQPAAEAPPSPAAVAAEEATPAAPVEAERTRRSLSGNRDDADERTPTAASDSDEIFATVTALRETIPNTLVITLDNGQVWQQTQAKRYPLRVGSEVRLYSTRWGSSYRLTSPDRGSFITVRLVR